MEERKHVNAFDWPQEFPQVMKAGGFDVVIGNPPYVRQESLKGPEGVLPVALRCLSGHR